MKIRTHFSPYLLPGLLFVLALLIRIPYLQQIPRYGDNEMHVTLQLVRGEYFPLYNQRPHIGAIANYIYALGFWILGMHYWVPRVMTVVAGSASVSLLYLLGKRLHGSGAAILGAWMMAFSLYHVYFISHVPWSNCLTPLFILLTALSFVKALQDQSPPWFITSGFFLGLALQTHPSAVTIVPALLTIFFLQEKGRALWWLRKPGFYFALLAIGVGYANMIYYNIFHQFKSIHFDLISPKYALEKHPTIHSYLVNSGHEWMSLFRLLAGEIQDKPLEAYWKDPLFLLLAFALTAGLLQRLIKRHWELPMLLLWPMSIIPIFNKSYDFCNLGRYFGFLIPLACLLVAGAVSELMQVLKSRYAKGKLLAAVLSFAIAGLYAGYHLQALSKTYAVLLKRDNLTAFLNLRRLLKEYDPRDTSILLPFSHGKPNLRTLLQSDGWHVEEMAAPLHDLNAQVQRLSRTRNSNVIALIRPASLKQVLEQAPCVSFDACLAKGSPPKRNNIYSVLLNNMYYVFQMVPKSELPPAEEQESDLMELKKITEFIPDDLEEAAPKVRHLSPLTRQNVHVRGLKRLGKFLDSFCTKLPPLPERPKNWAICSKASNVVHAPEKSNFHATVLMW